MSFPSLAWDLEVRDGGGDEEGGCPTLGLQGLPASLLYRDGLKRPQ